MSAPKKYNAGIILARAGAAAVLATLLALVVGCSSPTSPGAGAYVPAPVSSPTATYYDRDSGQPIPVAVEVGQKTVKYDGDPSKLCPDGVLVAVFPEDSGLQIFVDPNDPYAAVFLAQANDGSLLHDPVVNVYSRSPGIAEPVIRELVVYKAAPEGGNRAVEVRYRAPSGVTTSFLQIPGSVYPGEEEVSVCASRVSQPGSQA